MGPKEMLALLRSARAAASFERASFPPSVKEETRIYRETWILPSLDKVISALETKHPQFRAPATEEKPQP